MPKYLSENEKQSLSASCIDLMHWSIHLVNSNGKRIKIGGCPHYETTSIMPKDLSKNIEENFNNNGMLMVAGIGHPDAYVVKDGSIMLRILTQFFPVINSRGEPANINDKLHICLCSKCQRMEACINPSFRSSLLLSHGWFGLSLYGLENVHVD